MSHRGPRRNVTARRSCEMGAYRLSATAAATWCNASSVDDSGLCASLVVSRLRCNKLQCTAMHCNALRHTATHCHTLPHTATHCNTLQHTATHCNTLQHTATRYSILQHTATHCNTLQHTATHCNTTYRAIEPWTNLTKCSTQWPIELKKIMSGMLVLREPLTEPWKT